MLPLLHLGKIPYQFPDTPIYVAPILTLFVPVAKPFAAMRASTEQELVATSSQLFLIPGSLVVAVIVAVVEYC